MQADALGRAHQTNLEATQSLPPEIEAGAHVALKIKVSCARGCDLRGRPVQVVASDGFAVTGELAHYDGTANQTDEIALRVPEEAGEYAWRVLFPEHERDSRVHQESSLPLCFKVVPHTFSMAVWDVPSPVATASSFHVKVGVRCSAACRLAGQVVEVRDETETKVAAGTLGDAPWAGTDALYWTAIELSAPATEGVSLRSVALGGAQRHLRHEGTPVTFSFRIDRAPEHAVTVKIVEKTTGTPVSDVEVRVGRYASSTDACGVATIALPKGTFEVSIRKDGFEARPFTLAVDDNLASDIEAVAGPTQAEMDEKIFDDYPWG